MAGISSRREPRLGWMRRSSIAFAVVVAAFALGFGYAGLHTYMLTHQGFGKSPIDLFYYDIQLFVLSSPPVDNGTTFPILLQIARFAAPFVTVFTIFEAGRRVFASELALRRLRRARGHEVVCGSGPVADALAARLIRERRRVTRIAESGSSAADRPGARFLGGDPTSAEVLRAAGGTRARALYACTTDSSTNIAVALAASTLDRQAHGQLDVHVEIDDPEMCLALQARRLGLPSSPQLHVSFFSSHELAARTLVRTHQPLPAGDHPPRVMVVGASPFGIALVVELARQWRSRVHSRSELLELVLVDPEAGAQIARLRRRYLFLATTCRFTSYEVNIEDLLDGDLPDQAPDRVYLCGADEVAALKLALTMDQFWHRGARTVVVRLSRLGPLGEAFHATQTARLLDDVSGVLYLYDAVEAGSDADLVEDSLVERLGRAVHENYVAGRMVDGVDPATLRAWTDLPEDVRAANRAQAADVGRKLRAIGCALAPSPIWGTPAAFDRKAVEQLARMEHERWCTYMRENGWRYGPIRDDEARLHQDLVDWEHLDAIARDKDREAVREIPTFLADAGFQIVQVGDEHEIRIPAQRSG